MASANCHTPQEGQPLPRPHFSDEKTEAACPGSSEPDSLGRLMAEGFIRGGESPSGEGGGTSAPRVSFYTSRATCLGEKAMLAPSGVSGSSIY